MVLYTICNITPEYIYNIEMFVNHIVITVVIVIITFVTVILLSKVI